MPSSAGIIDHTLFIGTPMSKISEAKKRVLDQFEQRGDEWTFGDFESALKESMGARYKNFKDAESAICAANRTGKWPRTVERYSHSKAEGIKQSA